MMLLRRTLRRNHVHEALYPIHKFREVHQQNRIDKLTTALK